MVMPEQSERTTGRPREVEKHSEVEQSKKTTEIVFDGYKPEEQGKREVVCSLGNGYMGARSAIQKDSHIHQPAFYVGGIFANAPLTPREKKASFDAVPDLVRAPDWQFATITIDGKTFDVDVESQNISQYQQSLNMHRDVEQHRFVWQTEKGALHVAVETFFSQENPHLAGQRYAFTPDADMVLSFATGIDGEVTNKDASYFDKAKIEKGITPTGVISYVGHTYDKDRQIALASRLEIRRDGQEMEISPAVIQSDQKIEHVVSTPLEKGKTYTIDKLVGVYSSLDEVASPQQAAARAVESVPDYNSAQDKHTEAFLKKWEDSGVTIEGDEDMQKRVNYAVLKLLNLAYKGNGLASIAAKGLDNIPGEGYMGHVFWDTEIFMLPFYVNTQPEIARSLLTYRHKTLDAAQKKASEMGYEGALYAWESTDTGQEATPRFAIDGSGNVLTIHTGMKEFHINADIAYAVSQYVRATGDTEFMKNHGAEIIAKTARFWISKVLQDSTAGNPYEIKGVIGPDEYHEINPFTGGVGIDNNAFVNFMAQWNIRKALRLAADPQYASIMGISQEERRIWKHVADNIHIPKTSEGLIEQFSGFSKLEHIDLGEYPGVHAMDQQLRDEIKQGKREGEPSHYNTIKQTDTLLLFPMLLLAGADNEMLKRHYDYYAPKTSHGSSLSDATHAILALKAGYMGKSLEHLQKATGVDLDDEKGNTRQGTHAAAMGGVWDAMAFGYGGISSKGDTLFVDPKMPDNWQRLAFTIRQKGLKIKAIVTHEGISLDAVEGPNEVTIPVQFGGNKSLPLGRGGHVFIPTNS